MALFYRTYCICLYHFIISFRLLLCPLVKLFQGHFFKNFALAQYLHIDPLYLPVMAAIMGNDYISTDTFMMLRRELIHRYESLGAATIYPSHVSRSTTSLFAVCFFLKKCGGSMDAALEAVWQLFSELDGLVIGEKIGLRSQLDRSVLEYTSLQTSVDAKDAYKISRECFNSGWFGILPLQIAGYSPTNLYHRHTTGTLDSSVLGICLQATFHIPICLDSLHGAPSWAVTSSLRQHLYTYACTLFPPGRYQSNQESSNQQPSSEVHPRYGGIKETVHNDAYKHENISAEAPSIVLNEYRRLDSVYTLSKVHAYA